MFFAEKKCISKRIYKPFSPYVVFFLQLLLLVAAPTLLLLENIFFVKKQPFFHKEVLIQMENSV